MAEVGRPSELDNELLVKIKDCIVEGKNYLETSQEIGVPYDTFCGWKKRNYDGFADTLLTYEHERMVKKAEKRIEQLVYAEDEKVALNASTFIAETLGKKHYSKRSEVTGAEGKDLPTPIISLNGLSRNDSAKEDTTA